MKRSWIAGVVVASLGLSACGATATIHTAVASLGSTPDVQIRLTATVSGSGTSEAQQVLNVVSLNMDYANPTGAALSASKDQPNADVTLDVGTKVVADVREVGGNDYVLVNPSSLSSIPNVSLAPSQLTELQLIFGGGWFEIQKSLIDSYLPSKAAVATETTKGQAAAQQILDNLSTLVNKTPYTTLPNGGFSQTGSLENVLKAVLPALESFEGTPSTSVPAIKGTYTVTLTTSGSTATGGSITITAPRASQGDESIGLNATVTHNNVGVTAPTGATVLTKALLDELLSHAS